MRQYRRTGHETEGEVSRADATTRHTETYLRGNGVLGLCEADELRDLLFLSAGVGRHGGEIGGVAFGRKNWREDRNGELGEGSQEGELMSPVREKSWMLVDCGNDLD